MRATKLSSVSLATAGSFEEKIGRVVAETAPQFGSLNAHRMLLHLDISFQISLEQFPCEDLSNGFLRFPLVRWLIVYYLPMPKGVMKGPDTFTPEAEVGFEETRQLLIGRMWEFAEALDSTPNRKTLDPWLGMITLADWSHIHATHLRHHLGQFGVV